MDSVVYITIRRHIDSEIRTVCNAKIFKSKIVCPLYVNGSYYTKKWHQGIGGHRASGLAKIIDVEGTNYLRFEDFSVTNGPDLRVYVTPDGNVNNGIHLEKLKGSRGAQNYVLDGIDIEKYSTVVIYCQPFGAYFASSSLT